MAISVNVTMVTVNVSRRSLWLSGSIVLNKMNVPIRKLETQRDSPDRFCEVCTNDETSIRNCSHIVRISRR